MKNLQKLDQITMLLEPNEDLMIFCSIDQLEKLFISKEEIDNLTFFSGNPKMEQEGICAELGIQSIMVNGRTLHFGLIDTLIKKLEQ